jgi:hypothetical protein
MNRAETKAFNSGFLSVYRGWHSRIEYAPGGTVGSADALLLIDGLLLPLEVKIAKPLKKGYSVSVRPSQVIWHKALARAGGVSAFFIQCGELNWIIRGKFVDDITRSLALFPVVKWNAATVADRLRRIILAEDEAAFEKVRRAA